MKKRIDMFTTGMFRFKYIIVILVSILLMTSACKKTVESIQINLAEKWFEENILNRDYIVNYAKENSSDISNQFTGYTFKLLKNTYYDGPMIAIKDGITTTGTWSCDSDYGKLTIQLDQPSIPAELNFLNRSWRFAQKGIPVMKLAPWGSTADTELDMERL